MLAMFLKNLTKLRRCSRSARHVRRHQTFVGIVRYTAKILALLRAQAYRYLLLGERDKTCN
jgi:hypothetical protein